MTHLVFVFSLFYFYVVHSQDEIQLMRKNTCFALPCLQEGDECLDKCGEVVGEPCCANGLYCLHGQCRRDPIGLNCENTTECSIPTTYGLKAFKCHQTHAGQPGTCIGQFNANDKCSEDLECFGHLFCVLGSCSPLKEGATCYSSSDEIPPWTECEFDLWCSSVDSICVPRIPDGEKCDIALIGISQMCLFDSFCNINTNSCTQNYALAEGQQCGGFGTSRSCDIGLACNGGSCSKIQNTIDWEYCSPSELSCNNETSCTCDSFHGQWICQRSYHLFQPCQQEERDAFTCYNDQSCNPAFYKGTCSSENCARKTETWWSCLCRNNHQIFGEECGFVPVCSPPLSTWAIALLAACVAISILVTLGVTVFFAWRGQVRGGYITLK